MSEDILAWIGTLLSLNFILHNDPDVGSYGRVWTCPEKESLDLSEETSRTQTQLTGAHVRVALARSCD